LRSTYKNSHSPRTATLHQLQIADLAAILAKANKGVPAFKKYEPETDDEPIAQDNDGKELKQKPHNTTAAPPAVTGNIYFYHPDHLGTSTYLTDANGQPYQFFINLPFGEIVAQRRFIEHENKQYLGEIDHGRAAQPIEDYETPYKFN
jgi:hypothetical protein